MSFDGLVAAGSGGPRAAPCVGRGRGPRAAAQAEVGEPRYSDNILAGLAEFAFNVNRNLKPAASSRHRRPGAMTGPGRRIISSLSSSSSVDPITQDVFFKFKNG